MSTNGNPINLSYSIEKQPQPCAASVRRNERDWVFASYLMLKGSKTYLAWSVSTAERQGGAEFQDFRPEFYAATGAPPGAMARDAGGAYYRRFAEALAIVNPASNKPAAYALGSAVYHAGDGAAYTGTVTLAPLTAKFLMVGPPQPPAR